VMLRWGDSHIELAITLRLHRIENVNVKSTL